MIQFSYDLLKKYLKFKESPEKMAELLTMHLAETKVKYLKNRPILEVDLLPNRISDCSGHFGLLREIAAILGKKFEYPKINSEAKLKHEINDKVKDWVEIKIKSPLCRRYEMGAIWWVKVKESPLWLKNILKDCGLRPINNIVDAVNYVMLLTGQPLHAFDFQKVAFNKEKHKEIIIREAKKGEKILTLDNKVFELKENHLLITDREKILALAGIKGGKLPEVDKKTKLILIESANFSPENIRKTSKELNLKTDASFRFEHNLSVDLTDYSLDLALILIQKLAGGKILKGKVDIKNYKNKKQKIVIDFKDFEKFTGFKISFLKIKKYLLSLGFNFKLEKNKFLIEPPLYRTDILVKEDIIGDILRLVGLNNVSSKSPKIDLVFKKEAENWILKNKLKDLVQSYGLFETYNYSFISLKEAKLLGPSFEDKLIQVLNPTSELFEVLRPTLAINFLRNTRDNFRFEDKFGFFEVNNIYFQEKNNLKEETVFAGVLAQKSEEQNLFYEAKGILESLFLKIGAKGKYLFKELNKESKYFNFLENGGEIFLHKKNIGVIGYLSKKLLKQYDIKGKVVFWEIEVQPLKDYLFSDKIFLPLPKYPPVRRDLSFIISKTIPLDRVLSLIKNSSVKYLKNIELFDVYEGKNIGEGLKSLSFHLTFQALDKTLTSYEVDKEIEKIIKNLQIIKAKIR